MSIDWDDGAENKLDIEQWEADWDDDNLDDEFSLRLRYIYLKLFHLLIPVLQD